MAWDTPDIRVTGDVTALKRQFAELLLKHPGEPLLCASILFPKESNQYQLSVSANWNKDAEVSLIQKELILKKGEGPFLPSKDKLAAEIWKLAEKDSSAKLAALKLFAEVMGYVSKPGTSVSVSVTNRVIEVPVYESDEARERHAEEQQANLIAHADTRH